MALFFVRILDSPKRDRFTIALVGAWCYNKYIRGEANTTSNAERDQNMKMTKEVKTFAEREFNAKVEKARENFYAPITKQKKEIEKEFKVLVLEMNQMLKSFREKYDGTFEININTSYQTEGNNLRVGNIAMINPPKFESPDKVRFLAELSMGQDLSSITELLEKYFA